MAAANRPEILLLSLSYLNSVDEIYSPLIDKLAASANVKRAKKADAAIRYLDAHHPQAILNTDAGLTEPKNPEVLQKVFRYVQNGGVAIIGLHFPGFVTMDAMNDFFASWGLPWKRGDYCRAQFEFNPSSILPSDIQASSFPGPFSMKTLQIRNARLRERIFIPISDAQTQSHVFNPEDVSCTRAGVTGAEIGDGNLFYCGDVNGEDGSNQIILTLCGL